MRSRKSLKINTHIFRFMESKLSRRRTLIVPMNLADFSSVAVACSMAARSLVLKSPLERLVPAHGYLIIW